MARHDQTVDEIMGLRRRGDEEPSMITWEYRVFREDDGAYVIREVFYDDDGTLVGCTESAVEPVGESLEELAKDIDSFKEALTLPLLTLADIPHTALREPGQDRSKNLSSEQVMAELGLTKPNNHRPRSRRVKSPKRVLTAISKKKR